MNIRLHPLMLLAAIAAAFTIGWSASNTGATRTASALQPGDDFFSEHDKPREVKIQPADPDDDFFADDDDDFFDEGSDGGLRTEKHQALDLLEGRWSLSVRKFDPSFDEPIELEGVVEREWVLDGLWMREELVAENDDFRYEAISFLGYSVADGTYQQIAIQSVSTAAFMDQGHLNEETGVMLSIGSYRDEETGELIHTRTKFDMSNEDRHRFVIYEVGADGVERTVVQGVYERD